VTPEEKIEALRKLFDNIDGNIEELKQGAWWDGFYWTRQKVRDIIDPPKPKWRELVDDARSALLDEFKQPPLPTVLSDLAEIADDENDPRDCLARIVAVAEAQVGDGWQATADPPGSMQTSSGKPHDTWLGTLLFCLADSEGDPMWNYLANAAAAWLRDLCNADS